MMFTTDQLVAHLLGDYILQSHWMAQNKGKAGVPAAVHAALYTLPFAFITQSAAALAIICGTHFLIDRFRLARYLVWAKNQIGPKRIPWAGSEATGYPAEVPAWLSVWLLIIADNTLHIVINGLAIYAFGEAA